LCGRLGSLEEDFSLWVRSFTVIITDGL
jgi:hypothetical protein